jgi:thiamine-monophosphate kinase
MKLSNLGEFGLIQKIQKLSSRKSLPALLGIGDDAAALRVSSSALLLATTDMLLEGVHFDLSYTDVYSLGRKAAAVNLSDIAAMGGVPRFCLTSLGIPSHVKAGQVLDFYRGFNALLRTHKTVLVGGDTCASADGLIVSVTILGEVNRKNMITRAGAKPGDRIFVTNALGDSAAGLELLKSGVRSRESGVRKLIQKHLRPIPRVEWGRKIALSRCAGAMIDISDGLSSDLTHICEQSGVGAVVYSDKIPLSASLLKSVKQLKKPALHYALSGGEDYELLFTVPPAKVKRLESLRVPLTEIGTITKERELFIMSVDGRKKPLRPSGYDHFARS